jgi:hypothetical protein
MGKIFFSLFDLTILNRGFLLYTCGTNYVLDV